MDKLMDKNNAHAQAKSSGICYLLGVTIAIAAIVLGELLWLPAKLKTASGMQWIEMIDWLLYGLAAVPALLLTGALLRMAGQRKMFVWNEAGRRRRSIIILLQLLRLAIAAASLMAGAKLFASPESFVLIAGLIAAAVVLAFADLIVSDAVVWERTGKGWRFPKRSGVALLAAAIALVVLLFPTGYTVTYPGMTLNMNRYAHVDGGGKGGEINGVLVFDRPAFIADWLYGKLLPMYEFDPIPEDEPPLSEIYSQVVAMKTDADSVAAAIGMQRAGVGQGVIAEGARVIAVLKDAAAAGVLQAGDIIVALNDKQVRTINEMTVIMADGVKPGSDVRVKLIRGGQELELLAPTAAAKDEAGNEQQRAVFGISVQTAIKLDIPLEMDYSRYIAHVGGPSHGAMLTLAIIDQLTPGGVTGGVRVAGTGTIEYDGTVGLVGGVPQKAYAVSRTDADVFFVPAELEQEARYGAPELNIVPVETIDDILNWLKSQQ